MVTALSEGGGHWEVHGGPCWRLLGLGVAGLSVAGLAMALQLVPLWEPPSPTPDPRELALRPPQPPRLFFHPPQKPQLLVSAPARAQPHQPRGSKAARLTAPSGIALGDFSSAAAAAAAAMVARAAQNAN